MLNLRIDHNDSIERAKRVSFLLLDCDGVMTDGTIYVDKNGDEMKRFNILDGHGLVLWHRSGGRSGVLTGRGSAALERRVEELKIEYLVQRSLNKLESFQAFLAESGCEPAEIAYVGDDVVDVPVLRRVGLAVAPPNAVPEAIDAAHAVTGRAGGSGAVRDVVDYLLKVQGKWPDLMARYES